MARLFLSALRAIGHDVFTASSFRSWDRGYSFDHTRRLASLGQRLAGRLIRRFQRTHPPDLWFTYHVYHKAPDWLGPIICDTFRLPYIIAEASFAPKQAHGPWHLGHQQVALSIRRAMDHEPAWLVYGSKWTRGSSFCESLLSCPTSGLSSDTDGCYDIFGLTAM